MEWAENGLSCVCNPEGVEYVTNACSLSQFLTLCEVCSFVENSLGFCINTHLMHRELYSTPEGVKHYFPSMEWAENGLSCVCNPEGVEYVTNACSPLHKTRFTKNLQLHNIAVLALIHIFRRFIYI